MRSAARVAGVDGCKNGWVVVEIDCATGKASRRVVKHVKELLASSEPAVIAVDIPIGFPEMAEAKGRACEREARSALKGRPNVVFPSPARAALWVKDIRQASDINRKHHACGSGLTPASIGLFSKMREIDELMPQAQGRIVECHPELCFWAMNGECAVRESKHDKAGIEIRKALLARNGFSDSFLQQCPPSKGTIVSTSDDFLDACAAAWTARRIAHDEAKVIPEGDVPRDAKNIKMEMWY